MRNDIEEILSYAVLRGFYVTVTTNGTLITERRARRLARIASDRLHFNFSLDGDREANDEIRSAGMFDRAIEGYQRIRAADEAAGNARRKILANTILHARNADRFHTILDEQADMGFDGVQILNLFRQGDSAPKDVPALWFAPEQYDSLAQLTESLAQRAEDQGVVGYRIQNTPENLRQIPQYYREDLKPLEAPCWAGWKELYINADGEAIMCDGALDFLNGRFGNVREQTLRQLWASPALRARRSVVKTCTTPCIQDCYLRQQSDSAGALVGDAARLVAQRLRNRVARLRPMQASYGSTTLCLELSDVCPQEQADGATQNHRWQAVTKGISQPLDAEEWRRLRDEDRLDFGRGFMGFDVVRAVVDDIRSSRLRFGDLSVRWRGEPLLHPEVEPILKHLLNVIEKGDLAERLVIETDGRFLGDELASLTAHPAQQLWLLDASRGSMQMVNDARAALEAHRHAGVVIQTVFSADERLSVDDVTRLNLPVHIGESAGTEDAVWVRPSDWDMQHRSPDAAAALSRLAAKLDDVATPLNVSPSELGLRPIISWDGKVTLQPWDRSLQNVVGDVVHDQFSNAWAASVG